MPGGDDGAHCIAVSGRLLAYACSYVGAPETSAVSVRRPGGGGTAGVALLAALMRGEAPDAAGLPGAEDIAASAMDHGVLPVIHAALARSDTDAPARNLCAAIADLARTEAAADAVRVAACRTLLDALGRAGIPALVFKGGALAHSHYPQSYLRPRDDTDLLVRESQCAALDEVMRGSGYAMQTATGGRLVSYQSLYAAVDGRGVRHNFDIHWRISNRHRYARLFDFDELLARSRPLPDCAATARCPCPRDAVAIAALHRARHRGTDRLIWLYDIHLLLSSMLPRELAELNDFASAKGLASEYRAAAAGAQHWFGEIPACPVGASMHSPAAADRGPRTIDIWLSDLSALPSWGARVALLREHAFPSAQYMLQTGGAGSRLALPLAYLTRGLRGSLKLFRRA